MKNKIASTVFANTPRKSFQKCLLMFLVVVIGVAVVAGCGQSNVAELKHSPDLHGAVKVGIHELRYNLFGGGQVATSGAPPAAGIVFERGRITLDDAQMLIDNGDVVQLPDEAKIVRVFYTDGELRIWADGRVIYRKTFPSASQRF
jgi:hypothetical protein